MLALPWVARARISPWCSSCCLPATSGKASAVTVLPPLACWPSSRRQAGTWRACSLCASSNSCVRCKASSGVSLRGRRRAPSPAALRGVLAARAAVDFLAVAFFAATFFVATFLVGAFFVAVFLAVAFFVALFLAAALRAGAFPATVLRADVLVDVDLLAAVFFVAFRAVAFRAVAFRAVALRADVLAGALRAVDFPATAFLAVAFLAVAFLAVAFLAVAFLAVAFLATVLFAAVVPAALLRAVVFFAALAPDLVPDAAFFPAEPAARRAGAFRVAMGASVAGSPREAGMPGIQAR